MMRLGLLLVAAGLTAGLAAADPVKPVPITARVVAASVEGDATIVKVAAGSDNAIDRTASCKFIDAAGKDLDAECIIIRVDRRTTTIKTHLAVAAVTASPHVRLTMH